MDPTIEQPDPGGPPRAKNRSAVDHATGLILRVCRIAGSPSFVDNARESLAAEGIHAAIRVHDTAALFDWLVSVLSYQGIADQVAYDYMERHGQATWQVIAADLRRGPTCPKLKSYWQFHDCRYNKTRYTCAEPDHLPGCPLPPATRGFLLRGQPRIILNSVTGCPAEAGLGGGNGGILGVSVSHVQPHLVVGDVKAGQCLIPQFRDESDV
jgi:hypothetical protein